jgi:DNA-3-methyladenine glycosylase I
MENRCFWANSSKLLRKYHDEEWGKPLHDDWRLFEMLILEGKSCGLSWELILKKRDHMGKVFDNFDPNAIVKYNGAKIEELMQDAGIIRHRAKIEAVVRNAGTYSEVKKNARIADFRCVYVDGNAHVLILRNQHSFRVVERRQF